MWLVVFDPLPEKCDIIFTFAGENDRISYSKELFKKYPKSLWILSYSKKTIKNVLYKENLDTTRIIIIDTCKNTFSEVKCICDISEKIIKDSTFFSKLKEIGKYKQENNVSILLVSSPYHMRRIKIMSSRLKFSKFVKLYLIPVPFEKTICSEECYKNWWKNKALSRVVFQEIQKIIYFIITSS